MFRVGASARCRGKLSQGHEARLGLAELHQGLIAPLLVQQSETLVGFRQLIHRREWPALMNASVSASETQPRLRTTCVVKRCSASSLRSGISVPLRSALKTAGSNLCIFAW